MLDIDIDIRR